MTADDVAAKQISALEAKRYQAMTDADTETLAELFSADLVYLAMHDTVTDRIEFAYYFENGERRQNQEGFAFGEGLTSHILRTREPLLLNRDQDFEATTAQAVGTPAKSYLGVPILASDRAIGVILSGSGVDGASATRRCSPPDSRR